MRMEIVIISVILILVLVIIESIILIGNITLDLAKDFGIGSLDKSLIALYKVKSDKNIDYVKINENEYLVKNREIRLSCTFLDTTNKENVENSILEPATFELYKDRACYSVVKVVTGM